jgi:hypothetical protein
MSIQALDAAFKGRDDVRLMIVSSQLFFHLDDKGRIGINQKTPDLREILPGSGSARRFLHRFMAKTNEPITFTYFIGDFGRNVRIELDALWDIKLAAEGPGSFILTP